MNKLRPALMRVSAQGGFTLFEALVGVALMGLILSILVVVTAKWVPHWQAGFVQLQRDNLVGLGLDRLVSDLAAAEYIAPIGGDQPLFYGSSSSVTFVRTPLGPKLPNSAPDGLEIIRFADNPDAGGLVRSRVAFSPESSLAVKSEDFEFASSNLLIRAPLRVSFAFAGPKRSWIESWTETTLPVAIRVSIRNADSGDLLAVSTATLVHITAPAGCVAANSSDCPLEGAGGKQQPPADAAKPAG